MDKTMLNKPFEGIEHVRSSDSIRLMENDLCEIRVRVKWKSKRLVEFQVAALTVMFDYTMTAAATVVTSSIV